MKKLVTLQVWRKKCLRSFRSFGTNKQTDIGFLDKKKTLSFSPLIPPRYYKPSTWTPSWERCYDTSEVASSTRQKILFCITIEKKSLNTTNFCSSHKSTSRTSTWKPSRTKGTTTSSTFYHSSSRPWRQYPTSIAKYTKGDHLVDLIKKDWW